MTQAFIPKWQDLSAIIRQAKNRLTVFSPFYSARAIGAVRENILKSARLQFWTQLKLLHWVHGASDPEALCKLLSQFQRTGRAAELLINPKLHSKAFFADKHIAIVGSANLTDGGFQNNIEIMVRLDPQATETAFQLLTAAATPHAKGMTCIELTEWVERYKPLVEKLKTSFRKNAEKLAEAQVESDNATGIGTGISIEPTEAIQDEFVDWLAHNYALPGANHIVKLHNDRVTQRQQGHVKQCFAAAFRFLQEYPSWLPTLAKVTGTGDAIFGRNGPLLHDWAAHVTTHGHLQNDFFRYPTLRKELPLAYGGTHRGGGGASTTLKRILPLVAIFMLQRGNPLSFQS